MKNNFTVIIPKSLEITQSDVRYELKEFRDYLKSEELVTVGQLASWVEENETSRAIFNILGGKTSAFYRSGYSKDKFLRRGVMVYLKHLGYKVYEPGDIVSPVKLKEKKVA